MTAPSPHLPSNGAGTAAVVLAAGGGTRFAGPTHKLLAVLDGAPVVRHVLDAACGAGLDHVLVVTGAVDLAEVLPDGVTVVANPRWPQGMATSLAAGVDAAARLGCRAVVVGLGDAPGVGAACWRSVAAADDLPLAAATFGGRARPPVRIAAELWPDLPRTGEVGARALLAERPELVREVPCAGHAADVDTLEDLDRLS